MAKANPTQTFTHILPALSLLRKALFGLAKRQLARTLSDMGNDIQNIFAICKIVHTGY
jgi:hypothetical protein